MRAIEASWKHLTISILALQSAVERQLRISLQQLRYKCRKLKWSHILIISMAVLQSFIMVLAVSWGFAMHHYLASMGFNLDWKDGSVKNIVLSDDPAHHAARFIQRQPVLTGLARKSVEALTKESGRIVVLPEVDRVIFDVSAKHIFRFLFDHIREYHGSELLPGLESRNLTDNQGSFVVDFGAYDGIVASNSYNFLELHWHGLLVEPTPSTFEILSHTVQRFGDNAILENVAVGNEDKEVTFFTYDNPTANSIHIRDPKTEKSKFRLDVQMYKASRLLAKHNIPKNFGVLSIDVEGMETEVLFDILDAGYHPYYIVIEKITIGVREFDLESLTQEMARRGFSLIGQLHLNAIYHADR